MPNSARPYWVSLLKALERLSDEDRAVIDALIVKDKAEVPWRPLIDVKDPTRPTPQQAAFESKADILLYGGSAGGGKTDLICGLALTAHHRSIIFRREHKQLRGVVDRIVGIRGRDGFNGQESRFSLADGRIIQLGGMQHLGDEQAHQGVPYDLHGFDELTQFLEAQFRYVITWNRSADPAQRCRVVCASNPPTSSDGEWVIQFWAPWLDVSYKNPALPGELRWFISTADGDREVEGPEPVQIGNDLLVPRSRTFIPSSVDDNPFLVATGYKATLQALPEPLRSQMLRGDFLAGREDSPWQIIPSAWVEAAMERWKHRAKPTTPMTSIGVDVARGGRDETTLAPRFDNWYAELVCRPGAQTPDGPSVVALVVSTMRGAPAINIDVIGVGSSPFDHMRGNELDVHAIVGSEKSEARDMTGKLGFVNKRAELWWKFREALDPETGEDLALPPDVKLKADLCAPHWKVTARGIQVESKEDLIKRLGRSPDRGDAVVSALAFDGRLLRGKTRFTRTESSYNPIRW